MRRISNVKIPKLPWLWVANVQDLIKGENVQIADVRDHKALYSDSLSCWLGIDGSGTLRCGTNTICMVDGIWYVKIDESRRDLVAGTDSLSFRSLP